MVRNVVARDVAGVVKGVSPMTDEQRAARAREHIQKADEIIEKLIHNGAEELEGLREPLSDAIDMLDELEFEDGALVTVGEPEGADEEEEDDMGVEPDEE